TTAHHATAVPEITSSFTKTIPPPPSFFNPLLQQATPTLTPTTSKDITSFPSLLNFSSVFRFNDKVTKLEKDMSELKKSKLNFLRFFLQPSQTLQPNVTESLEAAVLTRSSSQPKSTYEAAASLFEFELTKILLDKMDESKSHLRSDYKKKLYDALVESYNTYKDIFESYGKGTLHWGLKRQHFYGFAANMSSSNDVYSRKRIIVVTRLSIMKKYDYGRLEEIKVRREDQRLYKFREGDFPLLCLQDIEDMLLLFVQQKLTNLKIDERLTHADELHKFCDGTLNDVQSALYDIAKGIRMEYLPKRKWSGLDKQKGLGYDSGYQQEAL
nr:hypothetical protein [Tanacetum cinerariifolium]